MSSKNEIINRVAANTSLTTIDLETFYPSGQRLVFDIADWLFEGLILRENDFRARLANHNWKPYENSYVCLTCSTDAIIPSWAYLLVTTTLHAYSKKVIVGDLDLLETCIFQEIIDNLDLTTYQNKRVIIKGCSDKKIPLSAYTLLIHKLQPVVKSIMFGEACSTVPLYKKG